MFEYYEDNETKQKIRKRFDKEIKALRKRIKKNGYVENLGQKEAREFNDWLGELMTQNKIDYSTMAKWSGKYHETVLNL